MIANDGSYSFSLGTYMDIPVYAHWSLILPYGLVALSLLSGLGAFVAAFSFVSAIYLSVLLHEYGHSYVAQQFEIGVGQIHLTLIGGIAGIEEIERGKMSEFWIAVAGPLVNVVIVLLIAAGFLIGGIEPMSFFYETAVGAYSGELEMVAPWTLQFWGLVGAWNVIIPAFNLLPTFPMDGGRILRSLLAQKIGTVEATRWATSFGMGFGLLFVLQGVWNVYPIHVLIGGFVAFLAWAEYYQVVERQVDAASTREDIKKFRKVIELFEHNYKEERKGAFYGTNAWTDLSIIGAGLGQIEENQDLTKGMKRKLNEVWERQAKLHPEKSVEPKPFNID